MATSQLFKTTASTMKKIAQLPRYRHPGDLINMEIRPVRQQRLEINGQLQFGAKLYPSEAQQRLVKDILKTRTSYRSSAVADRSKIASTEFDTWRNYLHERITTLPNSLHIEGDRKQKIYQSFLVAKQRNQQHMQLAKTVRLFYELSRGFKFDIAIHPLVLMRMVYPYYGYLNNFKTQRLEFQEYVKFLEEMVAVSQLFYEGSTLHGSQLLSFVFWKAYTNKPTLSVEEFCQFLSCFKFNSKPDTLGKDLEYNLKNRDGEIKEGSPVRFDFWRNLFLQRGL